MPYYYMPNQMERLFHGLHLHRWCIRCQGWVWFFHLHRHRSRNGDPVERRH